MFTRSSYIFYEFICGALKMTIRNKGKKTLFSLSSFISSLVIISYAALIFDESYNSYGLPPQQRSITTARLQKISYRIENVLIEADQAARDEGKKHLDDLHRLIMDHVDKKFLPEFSSYWRTNKDGFLWYLDRAMMKGRKVADKNRQKALDNLFQVSVVSSEDMKLAIEKTASAMIHKFLSQVGSGLREIGDSPEINAINFKKYTQQISIAMFKTDKNAGTIVGFDDLQEMANDSTRIYEKAIDYISEATNMSPLEVLNTISTAINLQNLIRNIKKNPKKYASMIGIPTATVGVLTGALKSSTAAIGLGPVIAIAVVVILVTANEWHNHKKWKESEVPKLRKAINKNLKTFFFSLLENNGALSKLAGDLKDKFSDSTRLHTKLLIRLERRPIARTLRTFWIGT